ncbi:hypothetical protein PT974_08405 [Cladobotryum mycophilum]|uniref:Uncharacterized protein n=1 Tax=Cladobotryum mycophilum TaxID=491253 RepID=A0ABR0SDT9_9HYPO
MPDFLAAHWNPYKIKEIVAKQWPDKETQAAYDKWDGNWCGRHVKRLNYCCPPDEVLDNLSNTKFGDPASLGKFLWMMEMQNTSSVPIGHASRGGVHTSYHFLPGVNNLYPHYGGRGITPGVMDSAILAINTDVLVEDYTPEDGPSRNASKCQGSGTESIAPEDSTSHNNSGTWVFAQIGQLFALVGWVWEPTDFVVVVRLDGRGNPGAVYAIYSFFHFPDDYYRDDKTPRHIDVAGESSRLPPYVRRLTRNMKDVGQFTVARIADNLQELNDPERSFTFDIEHTDERQIVRAKLIGDANPLIAPYYG